MHRSLNSIGLASLVSIVFIPVLTQCGGTAPQAAQTTVSALQPTQSASATDLESPLGRPTTADGPTTSRRTTTSTAALSTTTAVTTADATTPRQPNTSRASLPLTTSKSTAPPSTSPPTVSATTAPLPAPPPPDTPPPATSPPATAPPVTAPAPTVPPATAPPTTAAPPAAAPPSANLSPDAVSLANQQRANAGLGALSTAGALNNAAAQHSADQAARSSMGHAGSDGSSAADRIRANGGSFSTWGENVAAGYGNAAGAVTGWMDSPGHRANILNPSFTHIGVAVAIAADGTPYWTMVLTG